MATHAGDARDVVGSPRRLSASRAELASNRGGGPFAALQRTAVNAAPARVSQLGVGSPLDGSVRARMQPHFGADFSGVRVHSGPDAAALADDLDARAFTVGPHIVLGAGAGLPGTRAGEELLAHELAHVVQQAHAGGSAVALDEASSMYQDLEHDAETAAGNVLQRLWGTAKAAVAGGVGGGAPRKSAPGLAVQRTPNDPPAMSVVEPDSFDEALAGLRAVEEVADLSLALVGAEPLTTDELYELLLIRRAEPLSLPVRMVNEAKKRLGELDGRIAAVDKTLAQRRQELSSAQQQRRRLKGSGRDVLTLQVAKVEAEVRDLAAQRKRLLADKVRLQRGQALGTTGRGAPAGTGQITYAVIQVVDAQGKRVAVELAETSATEHAEERIVGRLRARFKPEGAHTTDPRTTLPKGAHLIVMADQKVCQGRCQKALQAFAAEYEVELVEARYRTRPRLVGTGEASPRTTLRTATVGTSADVPVTDTSEVIYRRPSSPTPSRAAATPDATREPAATVRPSPVTGESEQNATAPTKRGPTGLDSAQLPFRTRARTAMLEGGANLLVDLVLDLVLAKYQQWRNDRDLRERLAGLRPQIELMKVQALHERLSDPWAGRGTEGLFYNVYLKITATTATAIGGGRAIVIPGSPRPSVVRVVISGEQLDKLISEDEMAKVPGVREGATGGLVQVTDTQHVVFSEPVQ